MLPRIISAATFALIASALLVPTAAEAGSRWRFLNPGYYFYDPPPRDFYADDYDDEEYYEAMNGRLPIMIRTMTIMSPGMRAKSLST